MYPTFRHFCVLSTLLISVSGLNAQFAIGPKLYTRLTDDRVAPTIGYGLHMAELLYEGDTLYAMVNGGFDISLAERFASTATLDANDSSHTITVPCELRVTDYVLSLEFGMCINPRKRHNAWVISFGIRGIFRNVKVNYLESFDESAYDRYSLTLSPRVPGALNIGFIMGAGYLYRLDRFAIYPNLSFGFGSNDRRNKHPWNKYPNYAELSLTLMITGRTE